MCNNWEEECINISISTNQRNVSTVLVNTCEQDSLHKAILYREESKIVFFYHKPKRIGVTQTENNLFYIMRSNRTIISCRDYSIYEKKSNICDNFVVYFMVTWIRASTIFADNKYYRSLNLSVSTFLNIFCQFYFYKLIYWVLWTHISCDSYMWYFFL